MHTRYVIPIRQIEMLEALASGLPVPRRNAATRKALETQGLIKVIDRDGWQLEITERGLNALHVWKARAAAQARDQEEK